MKRPTRFRLVRAAEIAPDNCSAWPPPPDGELRLVVPLPAWEDFLMLALEEIRHYGAGSRHVMRRMRILLSDLIEVAPAERCPALRREQERLEAIIARSFSDHEETSLAGIEDRQGIGSPLACGQRTWGL